MSVMRPIKAYVSTPRGQIHYRHLTEDASAPALVLLHWTPGCGRMYEAIMPAFAARGYSVYAPDHMGMGRSDAREGDWSIAEFADAMSAALRALRLERVLLVAGHMSAAVGTELILRSPGLVEKVVLDGCPAWTAEERAALLARLHVPKPAIKPDGSHKTLPWDRAVFALKEWNRRFEATDETAIDVYLMAIDYLEMKFNSPASAICRFDLRARLPALDLPILVLTAQEEGLRPQHEVVMGIIRDAREHCFPGEHPLVAAGRGEEYVDVIDGFFRS